MTILRSCLYYPNVEDTETSIKSIRKEHITQKIQTTNKNRIYFCHAKGKKNQTRTLLENKNLTKATILRLYNSLGFIHLYHL